MAKAKTKEKKQEVVLKEAFYNVVIRPVVTEKATALSEHNKVLFRVRPDATKVQVKQAVEALFNVKVTKVNTINVLGKQKMFRGAAGMRQSFKKAVVTLAEGQSIDLS